MNSFVYVIGYANCPVKVGITHSPQQRLANLQTACPMTLTLHHVYGLPHVAAPEVERACHEELKANRLRGEWFNVTAEQAIDVIERLAPPLVACIRAGTHKSVDLLGHLTATYQMSPWAEEAISYYRQRLGSASHADEIQQMNGIILRGAGMGGLQVFKTVVADGANLWVTLRRSPGVMKRAEASLALAINKLSDYVAADRESLLLDKILGNAA